MALPMLPAAGLASAYLNASTPRGLFRSTTMAGVNILVGDIDDKSVGMMLDGAQGIDAFELWRLGVAETALHGVALGLSCPLLSGPSTTIVWTEEGTTNAFEEAQARGDHRQAT